MRFYKTIQLVVLLLLFETSVAQLPTLPGYTLQNFGAADGLLSSEILSLRQDVKDFIWIGTRSGISRYDGRQFENFEYTGTNRIGAVHSIAEDKAGTLWIVTETGLYYWNGKAFIHYSFSDETSFLPFIDIHFTADGEAWIGTPKGPCFFSSLKGREGQSLQRNMVPGWETIAKHDGSITSIHSSAKGVVFGTFVSIYLFQNNRLKKLPNKFSEREYLRGVFIDDAGTVYWNNVLTGFHYWDAVSGTRKTSYPAFFFDIISKDGSIYVYSNAGALKVDPNTKQFTNVANIEPLELRSPTCLLIDKEGTYWAGATEGLYRVKKNHFTNHINPKVLYTDDIYSFLRRRSGERLLGANRGRIFEAKESLQPYANVSQVVPLAEVFSMYEDEEETLWFGTGYQGIALYKKGKLKNFTNKNGLPDNTHYTFYKARNGAFWSAGDMGITNIKRITTDSFAFQPFFYLNHIGYHKLYGIVEAPDGTIWSGGQLGLFHLKNDSLVLYSLPELEGRKLSITAIKQDKNQNVWLSTRGLGILRCYFGSDNKLHLKKQWKTEAGLFSNTWLSIAFDNADNIWAGNYSGVTVLKRSSADSFNIKNFDVRDGFISKNYQSLNLFADGDTMWACTSSGAVSFQPAALLQLSRKARLYITSVDLLNTKNAAEEFMVKSDRSDKDYQFPHDINSFSVHFAALYYTNPEAVRYYYQLHGVDSGWTSTGTERTILFRQLPPGQYKLLVKASIGGSDWTNTALLSFEITKPWWLKWWVITTAVVVFTSGIYFFMRQREKRLKQREIQKIEFEKIKATAFQYQLEIQQVINYFTASMNKHTTVDDMLWDVAENCISKLAFEDCVIYLIDEERNVLQQRAAWGPKTTDENKIVNPIEIPLGKGIVGTVALTGKAEKIDDTTRDNRYIIDDAARASEITVPIYDGEKVIGVIDSEHKEPHFYTERHLQILTTIASHCGERISTIKAAASSATARMESLLNKQKALEASLQSMRLQMNPHFLFNALNSIQQMILSGEETTATRFLSKFSKLLRTVLTNSAKEEVSLKEEIDLLELYVELESLRFKESFHYSIECDKHLDAEEIFVPALLLQPLVENAIWHGLMHKNGQRTLTIQFKENSEASLLCRIEDNGVGRKGSSANGHTQLHTGKGLSVAIDRLQALNEKKGTHNSLNIEDLKDEKDVPAGTRIDIIYYH